MSLFSSLLGYAIKTATTTAKQEALSQMQKLSDQLIAHIHKSAPDYAKMAEDDITAGVIKAVAAVQARAK